MDRLRFGAFLAPHHPTGEHPTLMFQRDLDLVAHLDRLGYDEFWCGEHHSSGWETIASPEMFLAAAGQVSHTIRLGTGVVSLPYHHPFNVAQRMVQLDHMTRGRAMFGSGPGALPSDARTHGIDPVLLRDRQDEALGVIIRLLRGEDRFTYESDWITLRDAQLQLLPVQENLPMATASMFSPSGMQLAGKYGIGVLSIGSNSTEGLQALPTQWAFAEEAAAEHGSVVDRRDWRVLMAFHLAETREQAQGGGSARPAPLAQRVQRVDARPAGCRCTWMTRGTSSTARPRAAPKGQAPPSSARPTTSSRRSATSATSPGGFGVVLGFAHDWASREATLRSWDLVARYVVPEINGYTNGLRSSQQYLHDNQADLMGGASRAVMAKIMAHEGAAKAMAITMEQMQRGPSPGDDGEGDGGGVADVERVDVGVDGDPDLASGRSTRPS